MFWHKNLNDILERAISIHKIGSHLFPNNISAKEFITGSAIQNIAGEETVPVYIPIFMGGIGAFYKTLHKKEAEMHKGALTNTYMWICMKVC